MSLMLLIGPTIKETFSLTTNGVEDACHDVQHRLAQPKLTTTPTPTQPGRPLKRGLAQIEHIDVISQVRLRHGFASSGLVQ